MDSVPRLRIILDFDTDSIAVLDNGTGIEPANLPDLLEPYVSDKRLSDEPTRGHKGVGTTFLAYGHPYFEVHTRIAAMDEPVAYRVEGGPTWATSDKVSAPPNYFRVEQTHPSLNQYVSGTLVKVGLDNSTIIRSLSSILHNTPLMWAQVLRSTTAIGHIEFGMGGRTTPGWKDHLVVTVEHRDGTERPSFEFPFPHLPLDGSSARELQWLQNHPSSRREYELLYVKRDHGGLVSLLGNELVELTNAESEEDRRIAEMLKKYEVEAYASLAYKNTFYEEQFRSQIKNPNAKRLSLYPTVGGGILVASVSMPMGALQPHVSQTMQPQERRRYFLLLHFNEKYSPDIGRKTIPQSLEPLVDWLEGQLLRLLKTQAHRLLRDRETATRKKGMGLTRSSEELNELIRSVETLESMDHGLNFQKLILARSPEWESEVIALFLDLVGHGALPGYRPRAIPGGASRYDMLFDYVLTPAGQESVSHALRVDGEQLSSEGISLSDRWLEFKKDVNSFVDDLEAQDGAPAKKYFMHVSVLVCWSVSGLSSDHYAVEPYSSANWRERLFLGATHLLSSDNNEHRVEIIELRTVLDELYGQE